MTTHSAQVLEQHKQRVEQLLTRRTRIQVQLESARQQYAEAVAEANTAHGTSDIDKLRTILIEQEAANTKAIADFVRAVDEFENFIIRIESALSNPEVLAEMVVTMAPAPTSLATATATGEEDI